MTILELKNTVVEKIYDIEDENFLLALKTILDSQNIIVDPYRLNEEQREKIKRSKKQFAAGDFVENEKVFEETEQWLNEK